MSLLNAALYYADCGWRVFPCLESQKRPAIKAWQRQATADMKQIETWWRARPNSNIGFACGQGSGVFVIDVDRHADDGEASLRRAQKRLGALPPTLEQRTGSGGRQLFFWYPTGHEMRNSAAKIGKGIDTRGNGGFVVMPPSLHPCGVRYAWTTPVRTTEIVDLPDAWIAKLELVERPTISAPMPKLRTMGDIGNRLIERKVTELAKCGKGERNIQLYKAAFYLAVRAVAQVVDWQSAQRSLEWAAQAAGLDPQETSRTIRSAAAGAGLR